MKRVFYLFITLLLYFSSNSQVYINEVFATNAATNIDTRYYNYSGWVEVYNAGTSSVNLGNFYFSDDFSNKVKWRLPSTSLNASQFAVFWFDEMNNSDHSSFKLDAKGDKLFLFNTNGSIADSVSYPKQYPNISYARFPDGAANWKYNPAPTLQASNSGSGSLILTSIPEFSQTGGFYSTPFSVTISTLNPGAQIRYTLNGSEPKLNSMLYTAPIAVNKTTLIRAKVYETGYIPSQTITQSYIFANREFDMPVYSLTTDSVNLWDNTIGIYVDGTNGITGNCSDVPKNFNQDWERPVNIEFFDVSGVQQINQYAGFKIAGHCSRTSPLKSFSLIPRNLYGKGKLKYKFFDDKNITEFDRIFLRNTGNDFWNAYMRDAVFNALVKNEIDIDYDAYRPSVVYLNGNYWGMLNTREKIDEKYIIANYGLEEDQFDMLENNISVMNGNAENYTNFMNFVSANNLALTANYEYVKTMMDMNEYINYMILQIYIDNTDWPGNNIKYWRPKADGGKWRWILTDLDFGYALYNQEISHNTLEMALDPNGPNWPNPAWSTLLFRKLIANTEFKNEFIQKFSNYLNILFASERATHIIDSLSNNISYEVYYQNQKWNNLGSWNSNVEYLRTYAQQRPSYVRQQLMNRFGLSGTFELTVSSNIPGAGSLYINEMKANADYFKGTYFRDFSVHLKPIAHEGYKFLGWFKQTSSSQTTNLVGKGSSWKYSDNGTLPAPNWYLPAYSDASWNSGNAQLGYGDGDEATVVSYGSNPNDKYITTYFRKSFNIIDAASYSGLKINILVDDGAVVYVNGNEVLRQNMPTGTINNTTLATINADETTYFEFNIPSTYLAEGTNTIAVEVHQLGATSSDISFDLQLSATKKQIFTNEPVIGQEIDITSTNNIELEAKYQYLGSIPAIYFNEFVVDNTNGANDESGTPTPWIELYNNSNATANIAGWYISTDKNNLTLWQFPSGEPLKTTINPMGFKVLWADGQTGEGVLHLPFELSENGGKLFLTNITGNDTTIVDSLSYPAQIRNVAYGRYKDGTIGTYYLSSPTPLSANRSPNRLPEFTSSPVLIANDHSLYTYNITAFDYEGDNLVFNQTDLPVWLNLTDNHNGTATLNGTPLTANKGNNPVKITVSDGKSFKSTEQSFIIQVQNVLGVEDLSSAKWWIYPNPVKDVINIIPKANIKSYQLTISDLNGKVLLEMKKVSGNCKIDLSGFAKGVYFINACDGNESFVSRLVK